VRFSGELLIPRTVTDVGQAAFQNCRRLTAVAELSPLLTELAVDVFNGCEGLLHIPELGSRVSKINAGAFSGCRSLAVLRLPASVTRIESDAFSRCAKLAVVSLAGVVTIGERAFASCESLASLTFEGNQLKEIQQHAFFGCSRLPAVAIPRSVTAVGTGAFQHCASLRELVILPSLEAMRMGSRPFGGCGLLAQVLADANVTTATTASSSTPASTPTSTPAVVPSRLRLLVVGASGNVARKFHQPRPSTHTNTGTGARAHSSSSTITDARAGSSTITGADTGTDDTRLATVGRFRSASDFVGQLAMSASSQRCVTSGLRMVRAPDAVIAAISSGRFAGCSTMAEVPHSERIGGVVEQQYWTVRTHEALLRPSNLRGYKVINLLKGARAGEGTHPEHEAVLAFLLAGQRWVERRPRATPTEGEADTDPSANMARVGPMTSRICTLVLQFIRRSELGCGSQFPSN
jgi:hypothetical protein